MKRSYPLEVRPGNTCRWPDGQDRWTGGAQRARPSHRPYFTAVIMISTRPSGATSPASTVVLAGNGC
ncbi:MAG TPA: hypothetical protein VK911_00520, partial [Vicinamibacterales bacterium]|nr:hypothetical protein [Vicinamibacterales bacterium]